jgi:uncharacterized repeat protein (TIGR03803 family)
MPSPLLQGTDGHLYGTTPSGGSSAKGTIFRTTLAGDHAILHAFAGGTSDGDPSCNTLSLDCNAPLIQATDGNFYGVTASGGAAGKGTAFRMTPAGTFTILHPFAGGASGGANPYATLIQAADGNFYGTTAYGGTFNNGVAYRMTTEGVVTILHAFTGGSGDGEEPRAPLIQASDGNFYGTTGDCISACGAGSDWLGKVFRMTPDGTVTVMHAFTGGADSLRPHALLQASDGNLYGTTDGGNPGGLWPYGTGFRLNVPFADDPLIPGVTVARALHLTQLRQRIDLLRHEYGLDGFAWSDASPTPGVTTIRAQHILELRTALADVFAAAGLTPPPYTDPDLGSGTIIQAAHITELRQAVAGLESP